jgi:hypothetical protein
MSHSLEQWRQACRTSQDRADQQRQHASARRFTLDEERRIALVIAVWLTVALLAWWALTLL